MSLERISLAVDKDLIERFDGLLARRHLGNRSEAVRDLIRARLVEDEGGEAGKCVASLTLVYDHVQRELSNRLVSAGHRHAHGATVLSTLHVHLDGDLCLEVMALEGRAPDLRHFADHLIGLKGVKHGQLVLSSARLWKGGGKPRRRKRHSHRHPTGDTL
jgi:CopG family nickel-responsive transcriptional regulator